MVFLLQHLWPTRSPDGAEASIRCNKLEARARSSWRSTSILSNKYVTTAGFTASQSFRGLLPGDSTRIFEQTCGDGSEEKAANVR